MTSTDIRKKMYFCCTQEKDDGETLCCCLSMLESDDGICLKKHNRWSENGEYYNIRDYASINQLICLSNMENINSVLINDGISQSERLQKLNRIAIQQMSVLEEVENRKLLK